MASFRATTTLKGDSNIGVFLWILQKLFRTALYRAPLLAASEFAKSLFTYWLCINKFCLKTAALQILGHEGRHKIHIK